MMKSISPTFVNLVTLKARANLKLCSINWRMVVEDPSQTEVAQQSVTKFIATNLMGFATYKVATMLWVKL